MQGTLASRWNLLFLPRTYTSSLNLTPAQGGAWLSAACVPGSTHISSLCSQAKGQDAAVGGLIMECSSEVQVLYNKLTDVIAKRSIPPNSLLHTLLQSCVIPQDVELAYEALRHYRVVRSSKAHINKNFSEKISQLVVSASLRAGAYDLGLKTLWKHNKYGITPSLESAHILLSHAKEHNDLDFARRILTTMAKNSLFPSRVTANIVFRMCKENGDLPLLFKLAKEFFRNHVQLSPALYDICISCAANSGNVSEVWKIQQLRKETGLCHTTASAFSCAKALVLQKKYEKAAQLISFHCQDMKKRHKYLAMMISKWPLELLSKQEEGEKEEYLASLKHKLVAFIDALRAEGIDVSIDAVEELVQGNSGTWSYV
eukprot:c22928_g1_i1 orf=121-1236(+)